MLLCYNSTRSTKVLVIFAVGVFYILGIALLYGIGSTTVDVVPGGGGGGEEGGIHGSLSAFSFSPGTSQLKQDVRPLHGVTGNLLEVEDAILKGKLTLVDIQLSPTSLMVTPNDTSDSKSTTTTTTTTTAAAATTTSYSVQATFCAINWNLQQTNPSTVAMFRDLKTASTLCKKTSRTIDLYDITRLAEAWDEEQFQTSKEKSSSRTTTTTTTALVHPTPPTGVVFHETRCGSTLTANLLAGLTTTTTTTATTTTTNDNDDNNSQYLSRVYSESPPPLHALDACNKQLSYYNRKDGDTFRCHHEAHVQLIKDVFYMMGRIKVQPQPKSFTSTTTTTPLVFYKFQSIAVHHLDLFVEVFPTTPWMFLFRDSIEVMQSHLKTGTAASWSKLNGIASSIVPVCARYSKQSVSNQPIITKQIVQSKGKRVQDLTIPEYCAAHLAGLAESALEQQTTASSKQQQQPQYGQFVNYNQLPNILWESIVPNHFHVSIGNQSTSNRIIQRMQEISTLYSKGRGRKANMAWEEDSTKKQETANEEVVSAVHLFLDETYQKMEQLAHHHET